jgi:hypothetical protein
MKRKLQPARTSRVEYPTLEIALRILFAGALVCGVARADNSIPQTGQPGTHAIRPGGKPMQVTPPVPAGGPPAPRLDGEMARPLPPPPSPRGQAPAPQKVEKRK